MKITTITTVLASAATAGAVGIVNAPLASAEDAAAMTKGPAAEANSCRYLRVAHDHFTTPMNHLRY